MVLSHEGHSRRQIIAQRKIEVSGSAYVRVVARRYFEAEFLFPARFSANDINAAAGGVTTEQRALWPTQDFNPLDIRYRAPHLLAAPQIDAVDKKSHRAVGVGLTTGCALTPYGDFCTHTELAPFQSGR